MLCYMIIVAWFIMSHQNLTEQTIEFWPGRQAWTTTASQWQRATEGFRSSSSMHLPRNSSPYHLLSYHHHHYPHFNHCDLFPFPTKSPSCSIFTMNWQSPLVDDSHKRWSDQVTGVGCNSVEGALDCRELILPPNLLHGEESRYMR